MNVDRLIQLHPLLQIIRQGQRVPRERIAGFEPVEAAPPALPPEGGVKGRRKRKKDKLREAAARGA